MDQKVPLTRDATNPATSHFLTLCCMAATPAASGGVGHPSVGLGAGWPFRSLELPDARTKKRRRQPPRSGGLISYGDDQTVTSTAFSRGRSPRSSGAAVDHVGVGHQSKDRLVARPCCAAIDSAGGDPKHHRLATQHRQPSAMGKTLGGVPQRVQRDRLCSSPSPSRHLSRAHSQGRQAFRPARLATADEVIQ